jgi:hypothetical protein
MPAQVASVPVPAELGRARLAIVDDGAASKDFSGLRAVVLLKDGGLIAVRNTPPIVEVYDSNGRPRAALGRRGGGPGEFTHVSWVGSDTDSIRFYDPLQRRFSACGRDSCLVIVTAPPLRMQATERPSVIGRPSQDLAIVQLEGDVPREGKPGIINSEERIGLLATATGRITWIATVEGARALRSEGKGTQQTLGRAAFTRSSLAAAFGGTIWFADARGGAIRAFTVGPEKPTLRTISLDLAPRFPTARAIEVSMARDLERFHSSDAKFVRSMYRAEFLPEELPAFDEWIVDERGWVWVGRDRFEEQPRREYVEYSLEGTRRASLSVPIFHQLVYASAEEVVLVGADEDGLRRIEVRSLSVGRPTP